MIDSADGDNRRVSSRIKDDGAMAEMKTDSELVSAARAEGSTIIATLEGEIDLHNSPDLRAAVLGLLQRGKFTRLVLDANHVPYMDSSAIAVLVEFLRKMRAGGGTLCLVAPQPRVKSVLEIARLDTLFQVAPTIDAALGDASSSKPGK